MIRHQGHLLSNKASDPTAPTPSPRSAHPLDGARSQQWVEGGHLEHHNAT